MAEEIDPVALIDQVERRPELWDVALDDYHNVYKKNRAWESVATFFYEKYETFDTRRKARILKMLKVKWKSLRDRFKKDHDKSKEERSGQGLKKYRFHPMYQSLMFLVPSLEKRVTSGNVEDDDDDEEPHLASANDSTECAGDTNTHRADSDVELVINGKQSSSGAHTSKPIGKVGRPRRRKLVEEDTEILDALSTMRSDLIETNNDADKDDPILDFLKSLAPDIKLVPAEKMTKLKVEIMNVILSAQKDTHSDQGACDGFFDTPLSIVATHAKPFNSASLPMHASSNSQARNNNDKGPSHMPFTTLSSTSTHSSSTLSHSLGKHQYLPQQTPTLLPQYSLPYNHSNKQTYNNSTTNNTTSLHNMPSFSMPSLSSTSTSYRFVKSTQNTSYVADLEDVHGHSQPLFDDVPHTSHSTSEAVGSSLQTLSAASSAFQ
ncbi:uncharacterized protein [Hyperolius riggenbachi]|uniref:uncharacterized protein n=1 Tax=Hyperolius riggenbachi TaxID=752182 RepID=UPI0035A2E834